MIDLNIKDVNITFKNLINKYNNSIYGQFEDSEDGYIHMIGMHTAS